ncbi:MAG: KH domain-containing protein [Actinobacteria bacterium]|nr:KH domain-containing protein [Actinomycetota bacterium]
MNEDADSSRGPGRDVEGIGETVGEAKWAALRELERRFPGLDKASVRFVVVSEGERGILGVGYAPARVIASVDEAEELERRSPDVRSQYPEGSLPARVEEILDRVCAGLGVHVSISVTERDDAIVARLAGPDLGLLIGKHGQTIDAIQYLANAILWRDETERREVVVDAAGYRDRRQAALERAAERAARDALATGRDVALEPMTSVERKGVHLYLRDRTDVETTSEGTEPHRHVVVRPAARSGPDEPARG